MNPIIEVLLGTALIAVSPLLGRIGLSTTSPALFSFYDILTAFVVTLLIELKTKPRPVKNSRNGLLISSFIYSVGALMYFISLVSTSSVNVAFLSQFQLVFIVLISVLFLKEKINKNKGLGFMIVFIGGLLVILQENINLNFGWIFALSAFFLYSLSNAFRKDLRDKGVNATHIMMVNLGIASVIMFVYALITGSSFAFNSGLIYAVINGIISDVLGIVLITDAFKKIELSKAFMLQSTMPLFTILYSLFIFGMDFSFMQLIGGALLIIGNIIANKKF